MTESPHPPSTDDAFERRLRELLATELDAAERDFVPPIPGRPGRRAGVGVTVLLVASAVVVSAVSLVVLGQLGIGRAGPAATPPAAVEPTQAAAEPTPAPTPTPSPTVLASGEVPTWPGEVVARFESVPDTLAYDSARGVVWVPVVDTVGADYLYRFEPASRSVARWELPETTYRGVMAQVMVDDSGAVWVNHDGYRLDRFDPDTETVASIEFPLEVAGTDWANGGTWISAIAADGDGVLVARSQVPYLVRVGPAMTVTATIDIPAGFEEATGLAVVGERIFITRRSDTTVARLSLDGRFEAQFTSTADRLIRHDDGVITTYFRGSGRRPDTILDTDGKVVGTIPPPFTLPPIETTVIGPIGNVVPVTVYPAPSAVVDDGEGTYWYLVNGELVLREVEGPSTGRFQPLGGSGYVTEPLQGGGDQVEPVGSPMPQSDTPCPNGEPCGP